MCVSLGVVASRSSALHAVQDGDGIERDRTEAAVWFHEAAERGHMDALFNLGVCFHVRGFRPTPAPPPPHAVAAPCSPWFTRSLQNGDGVAKDDQTALKYWQLAAEQGHAQAQAVVSQVRRPSRRLHARDASGNEIDDETQG
jgi:hypothetical protein